MTRDLTNHPDALAELVAPHLGAAPGTLRVTPCTTGKFNTTWFIHADGRAWALRIAPPDDPGPLLFYEYRMMRQEPVLHELIRSRTGAPVPAVIAHDFSHERIDRDYLLMERLPGTPISDHAGLSGRGMTRVLTAVGRALREVHAIHGARYGYDGPHAPMTPRDNWGDAFAIMWNRLIDDIERCDGYTASEAAHMRRLLDRHRRLFDRPVPASLLHMDVWAQNILADDEGHLTGLIDWDRACYGDPEIEFAVLDYCGISEPPFWEGYGTGGDPRADAPDAQTRRVFYLLYEVQKYIVIRRLRYRAPDRADGYRRQSLQLAAQLDTDVGG